MPRRDLLKALKAGKKLRDEQLLEIRERQRHGGIGLDRHGGIHPMSVTKEQEDARRATVKHREPRLKHNANIVPPLHHPTDLRCSQYPSILATDLDRQMASRQPHYDSLPLKEKLKQEEWALRQLAQYYSGACINGWKWCRVEGGAYRCEGLYHLVSDELLAEGKGGIYALNYQVSDTHNPVWLGPLYGDQIIEYNGGPGWNMGRYLDMKNDWTTSSSSR